MSRDGIEGREETEEQWRERECGQAMRVEDDVKGEVRRPSYRAKREGARQRQNKRLIEGAKEVGGRNSSRTKGSDESRHVGGDRQTSTILHKAMLDVAILKRPRKLALVVFWQQRPTTSSSCRTDRKSTRLNSSHSGESRMPSSA